MQSRTTKNIGRKNQIRPWWYEYEWLRRIRISFNPSKQFVKIRRHYSIVYKKTDEWYIEWQRVVQRLTTNNNEWYNEWQRVVQRVTTNDSQWKRVVKRETTNGNEWQRVVQRVTKSDSKRCNEWQQVTTNGNEWERVVAVVQRMKTAQYTSKNEWLPSFQWQKQIHYYFKGWMDAIRVVK